MRSTINFRIWRAFAELLSWLLFCFLAGLALGGIFEALGGIGNPFGAIGVVAVFLLPVGFIHAVTRNLVITTTRSETISSKEPTKSPAEECKEPMSKTEATLRTLVGKERTHG